MAAGVAKSDVSRLKILLGFGITLTVVSAMMLGAAASAFFMWPADMTNPEMASAEMASAEPVTADDPAPVMAASEQPMVETGSGAEAAALTQTPAMAATSTAEMQAPPDDAPTEMAAAPAETQAKPADAPGMAEVEAPAPAAATEAEAEPLPPSPVPRRAQFSVQVGAFAQPENAQRLALQLTSMDYVPQIVQRQIGADQWSVVFIGPFVTGSAAASAQKDVRGRLGIEPIIRSISGDTAS